MSRLYPHTWDATISRLSRIAVAVIIAACTFGVWTISALALPDNRAYELVSPAQKSGGVGGVFPLGSLTLSTEQFGAPLRSSTDGGAVTYLGEDFYRSRLGSFNQYISLRGPEGWSTQNLTFGVPSPSEFAIEANPFVGFSSDLSSSVVASEVTLTKDAPTGYTNLYLFQGTGIKVLLTTKPPNRTSETFGHARDEQEIVDRYPLFTGGNVGSTTVPQFSHLLFEANDALTKDAKDGGEFKNNLYEWIEGQLRLVNVLPDGKADPGASFGVAYGDRYSTAYTVQFPNLSNVISADGSRIFWTDENNGNLYIRENGNRTVQVDASPMVGGEGKFQTASVDGSKAFFTKEGKLFQFETASDSTIELASKGVEGVLGASDDGSYVYFVSSDVLVEGAEAGRPNLYLSHGGKVAFIATLSQADNETPNLYGSFTYYGDWYRTFAGRTSEVSPNGRYLAFMAKERLTGYDNLDVNSVTRDYEAFLYDALTGELKCASCNVNMSRPTAHTLLPAPVNGIYQQRYLTNSGRLFFSTEDAVLPADSNKTSDVYEYEDGHVYLISPGNEEGDEAVFADASESGDDVFFTTSQKIVPTDQEEILDLYDARVDGQQAAPQSPLSCSGETCRTLPVLPPSVEVPPSTVFTGTGNLTPPAPHVAVIKKKTAAVKRKRRGKHKTRAKRRAGRARKGVGR